MADWELLVEGQRSSHYEISAVRKDNAFGHESWGWGGLDKIILFSSGLGGNSLSPATQARWDEALRLARKIVDALNAP